MRRTPAARTSVQAVIALALAATAIWSGGVTAGPAEDCQGHESADRRIVVCGELITKNPKDAAAHFGLGGAKFMKGDFQGAIADLTRSLALQPKAAGPLLVRASAYQRLGKAELELADLGAAVKLAPKDYDARIMRGMAYMSRSKYELALADLNAAQRIDAKQPMAYEFRIPLLVIALRFKDAAADCEALKASEPDTPAPIFVCALAYDKAGDRARAIALYKRVPERDSDRGNAQDALKRLKAE